MDLRLPLMPPGIFKRRLLVERDQPSRPPVSGVEPRLALKCGDLGFERDKCLELKLFLRIPVVRHMRHERAEETATGAGPDGRGIDEGDGQTTLRCLAGGEKTHDAGADDQDVGHGAGPWVCAVA